MRENVNESDKYEMDFRFEINYGVRMTHPPQENEGGRKVSFYTSPHFFFFFWPFPSRFGTRYPFLERSSVYKITSFSRFTTVVFATLLE